MAGPKFRKKISLSAGMKNQGLRDILTPTHGGVRVESVEVIKAPLHNTKIVIVREKDDEGKDIAVSLQERRSILYNRVDLSTVVESTTTLSAATLPGIINELNIKYNCDFTEDDLELVDGVIQAKVDSLGYFGTLFESTPDFCANAIPSVQIKPDLTYWSGVDVDIGSEWDLYFNGVLQEDTISNDYHFEDWLEDNLKSVIDLRFILSDNPGSNEDTFFIQNLGLECLRFELRPRNTFGEFTKPVELDGNKTFVAGDDGSIAFNLSPFVSKCLLEHAKPISLVPKNYKFKTADFIRLHYILEIDGEEFDRGYMSWDVGDLYNEGAFYSPIAPDISVPNNINSQFPSIYQIQDAIKSKFTNLFDVRATVPSITQLSPVTKIGYLGVLSDTGSGAGQFYGTTQQYSLVVEQVNINTGESISHDLGLVEIVPANALDAYNKLKTYFKPKLEALGFTVTDYNITPTSFISNVGFKLEVTSTEHIYINLFSSANGWAPAFEGPTSSVCWLLDSSVNGPLITEEDNIDKIVLTLRPFEPLPDGVGMLNVTNANIRLRFVSGAVFGMEQPENTYDWIEENFNGQELIIDSCSMFMNMASQ